MERKPKRFSSPKRNIYTAIPELEEKEQPATSENQNVKGHIPRKIPQKKKAPPNENEPRSEIKKKFENFPGEGSNKDTKILSHISELDHRVQGNSVIEVSSGQLFQSKQKNISATSKLDSFSFIADGGEPRVNSFFPAIEKQPLYSMAMDREKLKHSEFWPFDSSDDEKPKSFAPLDLKNLPHHSTFITSGKISPHDKLKKNRAGSTLLKPIAEAEAANPEKKIDVQAVFEKCKAEGRKPKNPDTVEITDEKKGKNLSPKLSRKKIKRSKSNSSEEAEKSPDQGKIKHLFSLLNMTDKDKEKLDSAENREAQTDETKNDAPVQEKRSVSPIASFLNKLNSTPRVFKSTIFDKASLPGDNLDLFSFPPGKSKDALKNAIKASKTFIAAGNKASKNLLKVNKATNVSIKHSKHDKKNKALEAKKEELKGNYYEINIHEKLDLTPSTIRTVGSSSFDSITKSDHDKLSDVNDQRPSSANTYKDSRHGKRSRKQLAEHPSFRKVVDDKKIVSPEQSKSGDKTKTVENVKVTQSSLKEIIQSSKLEEKSIRSKISQPLARSAEGSSSAPKQPDNALTFKNDNYVGVHIIQQGLSRPPPRNVHFSEDPNSPVSRREDYRIKKRIKDLLFYLIFLTLITLIALSMVSSNMFYFTDVTARLFMDTNSYEIQKKPEPGTPGNSSQSLRNSHQPVDKPKVTMRKPLRKSITIADFWLFAESVMMDLFYWKKWFVFDNPDTHTEDDDRKFLFENVMLGVPRIRQVRVRSDSCHIHPDISRFFDKCYDYYTIFSEDTKPISIDMEDSATKLAWIYTPASELKNSYYWGKISTYGGGGYYLDLDVSEGKTRKMIEELKNNRWISRGTRAVFIDFTIYNANANLFCICKIILEFPPMGGMIPATDITAVKLIRYLNKWDYFILGCEFVLILFIVHYSYEEVIDLKNEKARYFTQFWNYVDIVILGLSYTYIILNVHLFLKVSDLLSEVRNKMEKHIPFGSIAYTQTQFNNVIAVLVFFCWVKLFKYLNFNKAMIELSGTLSRCMKDIFGFALMFFTIFIAFAQLAYLLFGTQVKDYSNVWSSSMALLQTLIGEFEYRQIEEANRILGPIFYLVFIFFIFFILLNMFLAIINDAYIAVKSEVKVHTDQLHFRDYTKRAFLNIIGCSCCGLDKKLESKATKVKKNTYAELKEALKRAGYTDLEIEMFFAKYEIDINQLIEKGENKRIIEDLELRRLDFTDEKQTSEMQSLKKEIERLNDKIAEMQINLVPVIEKVDTLLRR